MPFIIFPLIKRWRWLVYKYSPNPKRNFSHIQLYVCPFQDWKKENSILFDKNIEFPYPDESLIGSPLLLEESDRGEVVHKNLKGWVLVPL